MGIQMQRAAVIHGAPVLFKRTLVGWSVSLGRHFYISLQHKGGKWEARRSRTPQVIATARTMRHAYLAAVKWFEQGAA